jgi:hypothetical protein
MPEVVEWLKTLGMSEYAERFAEKVWQLGDVGGDATRSEQVRRRLLD